MTNALPLNDPRLHICMIGDRPIRGFPVIPHARISSLLAGLVTGDHDLTLFDPPEGENPLPAFYEHAHYVGSLAVLYKAVHETGWIEHTGDWDWWTGLTLRDGTKIGDGAFVARPPENTEDEAELQRLEEEEDRIGHCDEFHVPATHDMHFPQVADPATQVYAGMGVHLEMHPINADHTVRKAIRVDQIAIIHIGQR